MYICIFHMIRKVKEYDSIIVCHQRSVAKCYKHKYENQNV